MNHAVSPPRKPSAPCFDAGSPYCPCDLAFLGECVACSLVRGEDTCRCGWSGMCIYREFVNRKKAAGGRRELKVKVLERTGLVSSAPYATPTFILDLGLPPEVASLCVFPGSFVMLRPLGSPSRYNVPLSVMCAKEESVAVAVEVRGPKTEALSRACAKGSFATVLGPYWSGLQGLDLVRQRSSGSALVVAKGIGQAPAVNTSRYILGHGGTVKALLGPGVTGSVFAEDLLRADGASVEVLPRSGDHNLARFRRELSLGSYDLLISEGSDQQHRSLLGICASLERPPAFAWSSNMTMTCAEGICGSCVRSGLRGCKASFTTDEIGGVTVEA